MKHFIKRGDLDVAPLILAVNKHADRFTKAAQRERAHANSEMLRLRMPDVLNEAAVFQDLWPMQEPAFAEAVWEIVARVGEPPAMALIVKLLPGGLIAPHSDRGPYSKETNRWHVPIVTNDKAWLRSGGERLSMKVGELWWFDQRALHEGANEGTTDRIHLIVDTFKPRG